MNSFRVGFLIFTVSASMAFAGGPHNGADWRLEWEQGIHVGTKGISVPRYENEDWVGRGGRPEYKLPVIEINRPFGSYNSPDCVIYGSDGGTLDYERNSVDKKGYAVMVYRSSQPSDGQNSCRDGAEFEIPISELKAIAQKSSEETARQQERELRVGQVKGVARGSGKYYGATVAVVQVNPFQIAPVEIGYQLTGKMLPRNSYYELLGSTKTDDNPITWDTWKKKMFGNTPYQSMAMPGNCFPTEQMKKLNLKVLGFYQHSKMALVEVLDDYTGLDAPPPHGILAIPVRDLL